jgi:hypothetical protein
MSAQENAPITFTEQEQVDLRNLNGNLELFSLLKSLLTQGLFPGNASVALIRCQQLADSLISNTQKQLEEVQKNASSRSKDAPKSSKAE